MIKKTAVFETVPGILPPAATTAAPDSQGATQPALQPADRHDRFCLTKSSGPKWPDNGRQWICLTKAPHGHASQWIKKRFNANTGILTCQVY
jgi:hypothetical protein